jgi:hypothetical protein
VVLTWCAFESSAAAFAAVITFDYNFEFSGASSPSGPAPWLTATFDDFGGSGTVRVTMSTSGLTGSEFVDGSGGTGGWFFNLNPTLDPTALTFTFVSGNDANTILTGTDAFMADGDGNYDIRFGWTAPPASRLAAGQTSVYDITLAGLVATDFNFLSAPGGGAGAFLSAVHVQGIGPGGTESGWVAPVAQLQPIPEPATLSLLGLGALVTGLGACRARRRRAGSKT